MLTPLDTSTPLMPPLITIFDAMPLRGAADMRQRRGRTLSAAYADAGCRFSRR